MPFGPHRPTRSRHILKICNEADCPLQTAPRTAYLLCTTRHLLPCLLQRLGALCRTRHDELPVPLPRRPHISGGHNYNSRARRGHGQKGRRKRPTNLDARLLNPGVHRLSDPHSDLSGCKRWVCATVAAKSNPQCDRPCRLRIMTVAKKKHNCGRGRATQMLRLSRHLAQVPSASSGPLLRTGEPMVRGAWPHEHSLRVAPGPETCAESAVMEPCFLRRSGVALMARLAEGSAPKALASCGQQREKRAPDGSR